MNMVISFIDDDVIIDNKMISYNGMCYQSTVLIWLRMFLSGKKLDIETQLATHYAIFEI